jgi:hypothetical protein
MTDTLDTTTVAATIERQKLQRHFGRFDILFFLICTIVGVDTIATVAQGGGQAFTWMMISRSCSSSRWRCCSPSWAPRSRRRAGRTTGPG